MRVGSGSSAPRPENRAANVGMTFHKNDADDEHGDHDDRDGIDHRGLHLALQLDGFLDVGGQPLQNRVENTARFARRDHVREQRVERPRVLLHRVRERCAGLDVGPRRQDRLGEVLVFLLRAENLETLHERKPGVDHDGELPREYREVLRVDLLPELALLRGASCGSLLLRCRNARHHDLLAPKRRDRRIGVVSDALAVDGLSSACPSRKCKCRHNFGSFDVRGEGRGVREEKRSSLSLFSLPHPSPLSLSLPSPLSGLLSTASPLPPADAACPGAARDRRPARRRRPA